MTSSPTSLIQVLDRPIVAPAKCVVCGSSGGDDRKFIDFNFQIDWYGAVYFCTFCFIEVAQACNFIENSKYLELLEDNEELRKALTGLEKKNQVLNDTLRVAFGNDSANDTLWDVFDPEDDSRESESSDNISDEAASSTDESSSVEGSSSILDTTESDGEQSGSSSSPFKF